MSEDKKSDETKDIKAAVEERCQAEAKELLPLDPEEISPEFVRACFQAGQRGDGILFATIHNGQFLYNKTATEWYGWVKHHWALDLLETRYEAIEEVVKKYLEEVERLNKKISNIGKKEEEEGGPKKTLRKTRDQYLSRTRYLRGDGADKCLLWAHRVEGGLGIQGEEFDCNDWLLACSNGVIELKTGRFRDGRPEDYLIKAVPHEWADEGIDCEAPIWDSFLKAVFKEDKEIIEYVQRLFGYGITGLTDEHNFPVLHGAGRNGKSTLVETINYVVGALAGPIQSEMLLDQRAARSSAGPSPDIMSLKGLRIAFASETDENRRFSPSKVKWLTGGDTLIGRNPNDKYSTNFDPTHLLVLLTNNLPHSSGDDSAFWARMQLVPFNVQFVDKPVEGNENERPRDKELPEKLKKEAPGILAWLIKGCIEWQREGLKPPRVVTAATEQYRFNEDLIAEFVEACCLPEKETYPKDREAFSDVYKAFETWFLNNCGDKVPKKKKFGSLMEKRFKKEKSGGTMYFHAIRLINDPQDRLIK